MPPTDVICTWLVPAVAIRLWRCWFWMQHTTHPAMHITIAMGMIITIASPIELNPDEPDDEL